MSGAKPTNLDMFAEDVQEAESEEWFTDSAVLLRHFIKEAETEILSDLKRVVSKSPFRNMQTPGGHTMSAAMTNCGQYGWVSDRRGYRYEEKDPITNQAWPAMPASFQSIAEQAANRAGYNRFKADVCLINCYAPGAKMSLHQDKDEADFNQPIVSVSLGVNATFLFGGLNRKDKAERIPLSHGDIFVWGGADRLRYHGILPLQETNHSLTGNIRFNLTFRKSH